MNILIVDYICTRGHVFFNKIHLNALMQTGHKLLYVSRKEYLEVPKDTEYYEIPEEYYLRQTKKHLSSIQHIKYDIKKLLYVKKVVNGIKPDVVVVLTYDALSLAFFRVKCPTFIINHVNVDFLKFWHRDLATRLLPDNFIHVCLTKRIQEYMKIRCKSKVSVYIPHGYLPEYVQVHEKENVIFCPTTSSMDERLLNSIIYHDDVIKYLTEKNIQLVIKSNKQYSKLAPCITILNGFIDKKLYQKYVATPIAIFLPYDKSFNYRASGIFHESLSYDTPIITSNIPAFDEYGNYVLYNYKINNSVDFLATLQTIIGMKTYYTNLEALNPHSFWEDVLEGGMKQNIVEQMDSL